jgi:acyl-CoA thioester hydrolase
MPTDPPAAVRLLHALRMPVRWSDMDALGHVGHAEYLRYLLQARIDWFESVGLPVTGRGEGPVVLKASLTFLRAVVYPSEIEVRVLAGRVGTTSFHLGGEIVNARDTAERFTEAQFVFVWTDIAAAKPLPVPERLRAALASP